MDEFELIRRFFARQGDDDDVVVGVGDDGAVLRPATGRDLVAVVDTLVDGVHYPTTLAAEDVGFRAVAVNLSDIAAMGARPRWMTLALTLTEADPDWLQAFSAGLYSAADEHALTLVGGDTTRGDRIVVSVQIIGDVVPDAVLKRSGARRGDCIYVSGTVGDAAAGLRLIEAASADGGAAERLTARFRRPSARVVLAERIAPLVTAAIDVSDGLYADLAKLLEASTCGGRMELDRLPLSDELQSVFDEADARRFAVSGGDDYELCFTAAPSAESEIVDIGKALGVRISRIGRVVSGDRLVCTDGGNVVDIEVDGYSHFSDEHR